MTVATNRTNRDNDARLTKRVADVQRKREMSDEDIDRKKRIQTFRDKWANNALPEIPQDLIPGYHLCWGTTQSKVDTIESRLQLGYTVVKQEDIPADSGFVASTKMSSGQYEGAINCNEMILLKLPLDIYQEIMAMMHHEDPLEFQNNITAGVREVAEGHKGSRTHLEGGFLEMEREAALANRKPHFY